MSFLRSASFCQRARQQVSIKLDDELGRLGTMGLQAHLATCEDCRRFQRELLSITGRVRQEELQPARGLDRERRRRQLRIVAPTVVSVAAACAIAVTLSTRGNPVGPNGTTATTDGVPVLVGTAYDHTTHIA